MVEMVMFNVQRAITPIVGKPQLRFMSSARHLMMLYICVKFRENISNGIRVMELTQNYEALTDGHLSVLCVENYIQSTLVYLIFDTQGYFVRKETQEYTSVKDRWKNTKFWTV